MMTELIRIVAFFKLKRNVTRGVSSVIYKLLRQQYKEVLARAEAEIDKVTEMSMKKTFTKEDVVYCLPFLELVQTWVKKQEENKLRIV